MQISRALRRMLSFVANIPRAVHGTWVNPNARRIRAGTANSIWIRIGVEMEIFSWRISKILGFKNIMCYLFPSNVVRDNVKDTRSRVFAIIFSIVEWWKVIRRCDVNLPRLVIHSFFWKITYSGTSWYKKPLCNEVVDITDDFLYPSNSKIYENQPRYNETLL